MEEKKQFVAPESEISRRQVMVGAAWAAPVVALAVAAPMAAASVPPPEPQYLFAGISATGKPGETLNGDDRPGARIRTKEGAYVPNKTVTFAYVSGPFTLLDVTGVTDGEGRAFVRVTFNEVIDPEFPLGAIEAFWTGNDGVEYDELVDVSADFA